MEHKIILTKIYLLIPSPQQFRFPVHRYEQISLSGQNNTLMNIDDPKCIHVFDTELASSALLMLSITPL